LNLGQIDTTAPRKTPLVVTTGNSLFLPAESNPEWPMDEKFSDQISFYRNFGALFGWQEWAISRSVLFVVALNTKYEIRNVQETRIQTSLFLQSPSEG
jgi:hypothetical protein